MSHPAPLKCAACGQPARVMVSFASGGKVVSEAWCETHAAAEGVENAQGYDLIGAVAPNPVRKNKQTVRCPACDCSQRDFERQGRLGCPVCYVTFAGVLPALLNRMHREVEHRGKIPRRGANPAIVRHRLALLQTDLRNAMRTEHFEGAAQTRDAIESLKAKLLATDSPLAGEHQPPQIPPPGQ